MFWEAQKSFALDHASIVSIWDAIEARNLSEALRCIRVLRSESSTDISQGLAQGMTWLSREYHNRASTRGTTDLTWNEIISDYTMSVELDGQFPQAFNDLSEVLLICPITELRNSSLAMKYAFQACEVTE